MRKAIQLLRLRPYGNFNEITRHDPKVIDRHRRYPVVPLEQDEWDMFDVDAVEDVNGNLFTFAETGGNLFLVPLDIGAFTIIDPIDK